MSTELTESPMTRKGTPAVDTDSLHTQTGCRQTGWVYRWAADTDGLGTQTGWGQTGVFAVC